MQSRCTNSRGKYDDERRKEGKETRLTISEVERAAFVLDFSTLAQSFFGEAEWTLKLFRRI